MKIYKFLFILYFGFCLNYKQDKEIYYYEFYGRTMGTDYTVIIESKNYDKKLENFLHQNVQRILLDVNQAFSLYLKDSKINRLNSNLKVYWNYQEITVFREAQSICKHSKGVYFPFNQEILKKISLKQIPELCDFIIKQENQWFVIEKKNPEIKFDFNSIAKGYGVDRIKEFLESHHLDRYLIEIGGEICVGNSPEYKKGWQIAIQAPVRDISTKQIFKILELKRICLASSGNYIQPEHVFHPYKLNQNPETDLWNITVLGESCAISDAYSTYILASVLNKEAIPQLRKDYRIIVIHNHFNNIIEKNF